MSDQQGNEPTVAHYQRTDPGKEPRSPLGQQASIEGMFASKGWQQGGDEAPGGDAGPDTDGPNDTDGPASRTPALADHNRQRLARVSSAPALGRFQEGILRIVNQYEEERRAEILARGGDPDEDRDPLEWVRQIAATYESLDTATDRTRQAVLDDLANSLTLDDIRVLRIAGEAAAAVTPRAVRDELAPGRKKPKQVADELGLSVSRIYQILRDE